MMPFFAVECSRSVGESLVGVVTDIPSDFIDWYAEDCRKTMELDNGPDGPARQLMRMQEISEYVERRLIENSGR